MSQHQLPASVHRASRALYAAALLAFAAAAAVVADQTHLTQQLHETYPQRSADQIDMAQSSILTYLFALAALGAALFVGMARAGLRGRRWVRGAGTSAVVLGSLLAVYNFSQPHPLLMTLAGTAPCAVALAAVALLWTRESSAYFTSRRSVAA
ncbi:hypothetical protein [Streptomyces cacaoi]|uniref:hypothetical protein n=1 Tax=Streptomyces cacaoi TaxID=1898 RepID=UPI00374A8A72